MSPEGEAPAPSPSPTRHLSKVRFEAFSDGVFAIAITLLILEISLHPPGSPLHQVLAAWPSYLAYVISFLTIGAAWLTHAQLSDDLDHVDQLFLRINLLLLLVVVFLPFPTRLVAESVKGLHGESVYVTMYGLTLLTIRIFGFALEQYGARERLFSAQGAVDAALVERKLLPVVIGYTGALLVGLVFPGLAVAGYFGIAVYLVVPFRELVRLLFRRS